MPIKLAHGHSERKAGTDHLAFEKLDISLWSGGVQNRAKREVKIFKWKQRNTHFFDWMCNFM